jgi:hypothetical protein
MIPPSGPNSLLKKPGFTTEATEDTEKLIQKLLCDLCDLRGEEPFFSILLKS